MRAASAREASEQHRVGSDEYKFATLDSAPSYTGTYNELLALDPWFEERRHRSESFPAKVQSKQDYRTYQQHIKQMERKQRSNQPGATTRQSPVAQEQMEAASVAAGYNFGQIANLQTVQQVEKDLRKQLDRAQGISSYGRAPDWRLG